METSLGEAGVDKRLWYHLKARALHTRSFKLYVLVCWSVGTDRQSSVGEFYFVVGGGEAPFEKLWIKGLMLKMAETYCDRIDCLHTYIYSFQPVCVFIDTPPSCIIVVS